MDLNIAVSGSLCGFELKALRKAERNFGETQPSIRIDNFTVQPSHDLVPHDQKCELALSHTRELFDFGEERVETIRTLLREELRPSQSVRIKKERIRYMYINR